jgi:DNA-binding response OmpR family regulator
MTDVLVIENSEKLADICAESLLSTGFSVDSAVGFHEGMTKLRDYQYQAIVMNPFFRDGSGDDMLEMLRNENMLSRVLVCSADQERVRRSIEQGIMAVSKPISFLHLGQLVSYMIRTAPVQA